MPETLACLDFSLKKRGNCLCANQEEHEDWK